MDPQSRKTASAYINNLLLSRGLSRNGTPIEFATPELAGGGVDATMAQVMNLVHDLILRRDRESDTLASLSQNLQALRTSSSQHTQTITKLESRNADLNRQIALSGAQERSARVTLKSAETRNRALREEMARLKGTVAQIRAQCATDVRRRDGEIQRLKRHLEVRRGRDGTGGQVGIVVVTPGLSKGTAGNKNAELGTEYENPQYSLQQETTEFLTQLNQGLSDENDALIGLVKGTLATLRSLQGLSADTGHGSEISGGSDGMDSVNGLSTGAPSYETLATSTDEVLEHLRGLLTNPSFVPLEEVEIREDEIQRLREGWEKMAARWKEAVALMDGWKKRMVDTGDTINLNDLEMGMDLGSGIPTVEEAHDGSILKTDEDQDANESEGKFEVQPSPDAELELQVHESDLDAQATGRILSSRGTNARPAPSPRRVYFQAIEEENSKIFAKDEDGSLLDFSSKDELSASPAKPKSRIPLQKQPSPASPTRTIQQKLAQAEKEAEEVRKRSISKKQVTKKLKGNRRRSTLSPEELENLMGVA